MEIVLNIVLARTTWTSNTTIHSSRQLSQQTIHSNPDSIHHINSGMKIIKHKDSNNLRQHWKKDWQNASCVRLHYVKGLNLEALSHNARILPWNLLTSSASTWNVGYVTPPCRAQLLWQTQRVYRHSAFQSETFSLASFLPSIPDLHDLPSDELTLLCSESQRRLSFR